MNDRYSGEAKQPVNDWLWDQTKGIVQSGPFKGMRLLPDRHWNDGNLGTELLGCYEQELHADIEAEITRLCTKRNVEIINVGCAEGYYAVGLKRRLTGAKMFAIDINEDSMRTACKTAEANGVDLITKASLDQVFAAPDLIICDCEGDEVNYLDFDKFPALAHATIIVECHDCLPNIPITQILRTRFEGTHTIKDVIEGARNPNDFLILRQLHSLDRWAAVSEGRPRMMNWLVMRPK